MGAQKKNDEKKGEKGGGNKILERERESTLTDTLGSLF